MTSLLHCIRIWLLNLWIKKGTIWNGIPRSIRKNGRSCHWHQKGPFPVSPLTVTLLMGQQISNADFSRGLSCSGSRKVGNICSLCRA